MGRCTAPPGGTGVTVGVWVGVDVGVDVAVGVGGISPTRTILWTDLTGSTGPVYRFGKAYLSFLVHAGHITVIGEMRQCFVLRQ